MSRRFPALAGVVLALLAGRGEAARGGPDALGYSWADSDEAGSGVDLDFPPFASTDLRALGFQGDDDLIEIALPASVFPGGFPFYGGRYSRLWLSSNGWISFVDPLGNPAKIPANVPAAGTPAAAIAFFWDDWSLEPTTPQALAGPHLANDGYTVLLRLAPPGIPGRSTQVRVILWASGAIKVLWFEQPTAMLTGRSVIGLENEAASVGLAYMASGQAQGGARFRDGGYAVQFFPRSALDCSAGVPLACPQPSLGSDNNAPLLDQVSSYSCAPGSWHGNERIFELTLAQLSDVELRLDNTDGKNRALFLLGSSCSELADCIAGGSTTIGPRTLAPGTYYLLVDGASSGDNGSFRISTLCSAAGRPILCGEKKPGESTSGTGILDGWDCGPLPMNGPERLYQVDVPGPATLKATISRKSDPDLWVHVSPAAGFSVQSPSCVDAGMLEAFYYGASGPTLITVDGLAGAAGSFDIEVSCERSLVCPSPPQVISLSGPTTGDTTGKPSGNDSYYCASTTSGSGGPRTGFTGPEDIWEFTLSSPQVVSFLLSSPNPDLEVFLLKDCYEGSCLSDGGCGENLQPGTYRVVVDGRAGQAGPYQLTPLVLPPTSYNLWTVCPECRNGCAQTPTTTAAKQWSFNSGNFCGTGCDFSLFAVVECGTEFHLPFYDVETGHIQVFDVYNQAFVNLSATNADSSPSCAFNATGTTISWEDRGCRQIPCPSANCGGGTDCRTNDHVMDVSFQGTPSVCGIYRIDFLNWGGYAWSAFANCSGDATELYNLYRDLCSAMAAYNPLPEIAVTDVYTDNTTCGGTGDASGTVTITNIGCLPAAEVEVRIEPTTPPGPPPVVIRATNIDKGASVQVPWSFPVPSRPYSLTFTVDPVDQLAECSEGLGGAVRCGKTTVGKRVWQAAVCGSDCNTLARTGPKTTICAGQGFTLDGASSRFQCSAGGIQQYRWEDALGNPLPGCDWSTAPNCDLTALQLPSGVHDFTLRTRCFGNLPCESQAYTQLDVSTVNIPPEGLGNTLWARRSGADAWFWWPPLLQTPIQGYRVYKDGDRQVPAPSRLLAATATSLEQSATDVNAVTLPPVPVAYYQVVGVSCAGNLESPY